MYPILFSFGSISIYSFSVCMTGAWLVFSFLFWKSLRQYAVDEDKIYDIMFYSTITAFIAARLAYVLFHWDLFADTWLKIIAIWVTPGLSLYGGLIGAILTFMSLSKSLKVRFGLVLDAFVQAFPAAVFVGCIGTFLDGTTTGLMTNVPWAMRPLGDVGLRHPVALYQAIVCIAMGMWIAWFTKRSARLKMPYGLVGLMFFLPFSVLMFVVEFFSVRKLYWLSLSASQWILLAIFAESLGAYYVRGGAREHLRPLTNRVLHILSVLNNKIRR